MLAEGSDEPLPRNDASAGCERRLERPNSVRFRARLSKIDAFVSRILRSRSHGPRLRDLDQRPRRRFLLPDCRASNSKPDWFARLTLIGHPALIFTTDAGLLRAPSRS
jgi:hypothetical protein